MIDKLHRYLAAVPPGPITDTGTLARLLADAWGEFGGDDGGIIPAKHLNRMEDVAWKPPLLTFTTERHGGTVMGSSRATLQEWTVNVEKMTVACVEARHRQVRPMQARLDLAAIAEEIVAQVVNRQQDHRLKWYADGRVRVLVGKVLLEGAAVRQTLAGRRKRLRAAVKERLEMERWEEVSVHVYRPWATKHKQVRIKDGDFEADIDEELAPLIRELWEANLATVLSCQENRPGIVWIMFLTAGDLSEFLGIVAEYQPECESLYRRILADTDVEGCWEYDFSPVDDALHDGRDGIADWHEGTPDFYFHASVRFPRTDLPILLDRMVQHNAFIRMLKSKLLAPTLQ